MGNQDSRYGHIKQNILLILPSAALVFGGLSVYMVTFPTYSPSMRIVGGILGGTGFLAMVFRNYSSKPVFFWFLYLDLIILFALSAIRSLNYVFQGQEIFLTTLISASVIAAYLLPIINPRFAKFLKTELTAPQTIGGKLFYRYGLLLIPFFAVAATIFGMVVDQNEKFVYTLVLGSLSWVLALILPYGTVFPISPFEKEIR